jgi:hypothetical protein
MSCPVQLGPGIRVQGWLVFHRTSKKPICNRISVAKMIVGEPLVERMNELYNDSGEEIAVTIL